MQQKVSSGMKADVVLDAYGLICPMPIAKTCQAIKEMKVGEVLEVIADNRGIVEDMHNWCNTTAHEFLGVLQEDDEYHLFVRKRADEEDACQRPPCH
jgi:TusA-related sulfurtransferase